MLQRKFHSKLITDTGNGGQIFPGEFETKKKKKNVIHK